jgi:hypothetical protein
MPAHRNPHPEDEVARDVEKQYEQDPPQFDLELEAGLVLDVCPHEIEADHEHQQQNHRDLLEEHEQQHGGHPTAGLAA